VGGRVSTTGTINGSLTLGNTGGLFGALNISQQETITDWACAGGWIINSDPFSSTTGTVTVTGDNVSFSTRYSGGTVAQSTRGGADQACHITFDVFWTSATGGTFSGTADCGPAGFFRVSGTF